MPLDPRGLLPVVNITQGPSTTVSQTCNPFTDDFDFHISRLVAKPAFDATGGNIDMDIMGATPGATNALLNSISEGFEVRVGVGKTAAVTQVGLYTIEKLEIRQPVSGVTYLNLFGWDWGTDLLNGRIVNGSRIQARLDSDGVSPDPADKSTTFFNLAKWLLGAALDTESQPDKSAYPGDKSGIFTRHSAVDQGLLVNDANIFPGNATGDGIPEFEVRLQRLNDALSTIDSFAGTTHFAKHTKEFIMQPPYGFGPIWESGILIVDNPFDPLLAGWDPTKYGIMKKFTKIHSLENHRVNYIASGQIDMEKDQSAEITTNSFQTNGDKYLAMWFQPTQKHCKSIALRVTRTGVFWEATQKSPTLDIEIVEDLAGEPMGAIIHQDSKLPAGIPQTGPMTWHWFAVNKDLNNSKKHWIVVKPTGSAAHYYAWAREQFLQGGGLSSTDGATWAPLVNATSPTGANTFAFRTYITYPILSISNPLALPTQKHYWEEVYNTPVLNSATAMGKYVANQIRTQGKRKETIIMEVKPPDVILQPGMSIRVKKSLSGYTMDADGSTNNQLFVISGLQYVFDQADESRTGQLSVEITASRFTDYPF